MQIERDGPSLLIAGWNASWFIERQHEYPFTCFAPLDVAPHHFSSVHQHIAHVRVPDLDNNRAIWGFRTRDHRRQFLLWMTADNKRISSKT